MRIFTFAILFWMAICALIGVEHLSRRQVAPTDTVASDSGRGQRLGSWVLDGTSNDSAMLPESSGNSAPPTQFISDSQRGGIRASNGEGVLSNAVTSYGVSNSLESTDSKDLKELLQDDPPIASRLDMGDLWGCAYVSPIEVLTTPPIPKQSPEPNELGLILLSLLVLESLRRVRGK